LAWTSNAALLQRQNQKIEPALTVTDIAAAPHLGGKDAWRCQSRYDELKNYNAATESAQYLPFSPDPARGFAALAPRQPDLDSFLQADPYLHSFLPDW